MRLSETNQAFVVQRTVRKSEESLDVEVRAFPKTSFSSWWKRVKRSIPAREPAAWVGLYHLPDRNRKRAAGGYHWLWTSMTLPVPEGRYGHTAVWTGSEMIIWGGSDGTQAFNNGARYDPRTDTWTPTSTGAGCPSARDYHTAVWSGSEMIVWGGALDNTGARYDPKTDIWTPTETGTVCPLARKAASAVWADSGMIVWGGKGQSLYWSGWNLNSGGYYTALPGDDFILGEGPGAANPNLVRVYTNLGTNSGVGFAAYGAGAFGVNVASGDIDGGAHDEILTGPGPGPIFGPQVRGFRRSGAPLGKVNFYAYGTLRYGVHPGAGNIDDDLFAELLTGPGGGDVFGPHVRGFDYDNVKVKGIARLSFYAYKTLKFGANVSSGDIDSDGYLEILTAPGPGVIFGPQVRGFNYDGSALSSMGKVNYNAFSTPRYGARVAGGDFDGDGYAEIAAAEGPGRRLPARFVGHNFDGSGVASMPGFDITPFVTYYGGSLGSGDINSDGQQEILTGSGSDPAADATSKAFTYDGSGLDKIFGSFNAFPGSRFGIRVAGGNLGY